MKRWFDVKAKAENAAEIYIYDQIGKDYWGDNSAVEAKKFIKEVKALGDLASIDLRINSPGGSVFEGNAIYNFLNQHPAEITVYIDGLAASMASVIAMVGDKVIMPENAMIMIHNPLTLAVGNAEDLRKTADMLDKIKEGAISAYETKSTADRAEISRLMDAETWMTAEEAVDLGFADEIMSAKQIAASFDLSHFRRPPVQFLAPVAVEPPEAGETQSEENEEPKAMDKAKLLAEFPQLYNEIVAEGATAERERIKNVEAQALPGFESIIQSAKYDGKTTGPEVAVLVLQAQKAQMEKIKADLRSDAPAAILQSEPADMLGSELEEVDLNDPEALKAKWEKSAKLKQEFMTAENYIGFMQAQAAGQVRIYGVPKAQ